MLGSMVANMPFCKRCLLDMWRIMNLQCQTSKANRQDEVFRRISSLIDIFITTRCMTSFAKTYILISNEVCCCKADDFLHS